MKTTGKSSGNQLQPPESGACEADPIDTLLSRNPVLWRGCDMAGRGSHGQTTGYPALDDILPGRGWPRHAIVEIVSRQWGTGELQLLVPLMRTVVRQGRWILWISPPYLLNSPALLQAGIDPEQVLVINLDTSTDSSRDGPVGSFRGNSRGSAWKDALWSMEKALQTESCGLVLAWQNWLPDKVVRRLQLAAAAGETLGVLFQHKASKCSHSFLRLEIRPLKQNLYENNPTRNTRSLSADKAADRVADQRAGQAANSGGTARQGYGSGPATTQITVLKARGNFRPLSVRLNLYPESLPLQLSGQDERP